MCWEVWGTMAKSKVWIHKSKRNRRWKKRGARESKQKDHIMQNKQKWLDNKWCGVIDYRPNNTRKTTGVTMCWRSRSHLGCAGHCLVWRDRTALTGRGSVRRRSSRRRPWSAASVAETGHHLSGALREDELLPQLHVGPAFSYGMTLQMSHFAKIALMMTSNIHLK